MTLHSQIVAAVIRRGTQVLLVRQASAGDPVGTWALPGGRVEVGESLVEVLIREIREETGLEVETVDRLVYVAQIENPESSVHPTGELPGPGGTATAFVFDITRFRGDLRPTDPDDLILDVEFVDRDEAAKRLEALPWRPMSEPIVQALRGESPAGALWLYRWDGDAYTLLSRVPAQASLSSGRTGAVTALDARSQREKGYIILGCLVVTVLLVVIVIAGIIATAHSHVF